MASRDKPYTIEHTDRRLIEHKLLTTLAEGDKVAIIATKEDLEVLMLALKTFDCPLKMINVKQDLLEGMEIMFKKVFK